MSIQNLRSLAWVTNEEWVYNELIVRNAHTEFLLTAATFLFQLGIMSLPALINGHHYIYRATIPFNIYGATIDSILSMVHTQLRGVAT